MCRPDCVSVRLPSCLGVHCLPLAGWLSAATFRAASFFSVLFAHVPFQSSVQVLPGVCQETLEPVVPDVVFFLSLCVQITENLTFGLFVVPFDVCLGIPHRRPLWGRENAAQIFSGSYGRVPAQTHETDDEHLSVIVSYFLPIRYFSSSKVFSVWISSSHLRRTVPGVRATGVQVDGAPPSRASLLLFSVLGCCVWSTRR